MTNEAQKINQQLGVDDAVFMKGVTGGDWDELANGFEENLRRQIASSADFCVQTMQATREAGTMNTETGTLINGTMRDLNIYASRLNALISRRDSRHGRTRTSAEYTEYMAIGLELSTLREELQTVISNNLFNLTEAHDQALTILRQRAEEEKAQSDLTDPTVVTDVTVKEINPQ